MTQRPAAVKLMAILHSYFSHRCSRQAAASVAFGNWLELQPFGAEEMAQWLRTCTALAEDSLVSTFTSSSSQLLVTPVPGHQHRLLVSVSTTALVCEDKHIPYTHN